MLGSSTITLRRSASGAYDALGHFVEGATTDVSIQGSVQPANGRDLQLLPEGQRHDDTRKVYTKAEVRTADQHTGTGADLLLIDGAWFQVQLVAPYPRLRAHRKVLCKRVLE